MNKNRFLLFSFICLLNVAIGQKNNHVFIELGGNAHYGSVNYEHFFIQKGKCKLGARIGLSSLNFKDYQNRFNPDLIIPIGPTLSFGKTHHAELDLINTFSSTIAASGNGSSTRNLSLNGGCFLGYRFQKDEGNWVFRAGYTPIFEKYKSIRHWAGLSIGFQF